MPVSAFQILAVRSLLAVASSVPSRLKATPWRAPAWKKTRSSFPEVTSHIFAVRSELAVARRLMSGLKAAPVTEAVWPVKVCRTIGDCTALWSAASAESVTVPSEECVTVTACMARSRLRLGSRVRLRKALPAFAREREIFSSVSA